MLKRFLHLLLAGVVGATLAVAAAPSLANASEADVYTTPGHHLESGRYWSTDCEMYSSSIVRCSTDIWATTYVNHEGSYYNHDAWTFNNLTYLPAPRAAWGNNPLANDGSWTAADGRKWRTECDTPATGSDGCRSYVMARMVVAQGSGHVVKDVEVLNNIIQFSTSTLAPVTSVPAAATAPAGVPAASAFVPPVNTNPVDTCKASYYGGHFQGRKTASGERFNTYDLTAAHKTYKFGTRVKVTNPSNGKSVTVRINDRGPFIAGRCLDLSTAAMQAVGGTSAGVITVNYQVVG